MKIKKDELKRIIRERIYDNTQVKNYKGFDMSGYNEAHYGNLELLAKFKDLLTETDKSSTESRPTTFVIPSFSKGSCALKTIGGGETSQHQYGEIDLSCGETTKDILFKIITMQNPGIIEE